jgi:4-diphosphocytidyl-2C-methyl-D-erythritol kinase
VLADALAALRASGARIALLAGSGSSIFVIFDDASACDAAAAQINALGLRRWRAETLG